MITFAKNAPVKRRMWGKRLRALSKKDLSDIMKHFFGKTTVSGEVVLTYRKDGKIVARVRKATKPKSEGSGGGSGRGGGTVVGVTLNDMAAMDFL